MTTIAASNCGILHFAVQKKWLVAAAEVLFILQIQYLIFIRLHSLTHTHTHTHMGAISFALALSLCMRYLNLYSLYIHICISICMCVFVGDTFACSCVHSLPASFATKFMHVLAFLASSLNECAYISFYF